MADGANDLSRVGEGRSSLDAPDAKVAGMAALITRLRTALEMWQNEHPLVYRVWSNPRPDGCGEGGAGMFKCDCPKCKVLHETLAVVERQSKEPALGQLPLREKP